MFPRPLDKTPSLKRVTRRRTKEACQVSQLHQGDFLTRFGKKKKKKKCRHAGKEGTLLKNLDEDGAIH